MRPLRARHFLALVAAVIASMIWVGTPQPVDATPTTSLLVGDSVMAGMGSGARSVIPNHFFDAYVCRRLISTSCSYQGYRPPTALSVVRANAGRIDNAVVIGAGYNDGSVGTAVDAIVAEARRQGIPHVVWLTYRVAGGFASTYRSHNATLWTKAAQYPDLYIADWASLSAGRSDWVASDGLHLNSSGASAMANLIAGALASLPPPPPPPPPPLAASGRLCFDVAGSPGDAAVVNLTPVLAQTSGHGQLISSNITTPPQASNVNYAPGTTDPNIAIATIGTDGQVCFVNSNHGTIHLVADHLGTITADNYTPATTTGAPHRKVDTRIALGGTAIAPSGRLCFDVAGSPGDAAVVNLTPVLAQTSGHGQLISSNITTPPQASNVNYAPGTTDPNIAIATIGTDGQVCFVNSNHGTIHLVADHLGTITADNYTPATTTGAPHRKVDTRIALGGTAIAPSGRLCFDVAGSPGDAAVVNLTPVLAQTSGHGQLISSNITTPPQASNVNYAPGTTDPNIAIATIGTDGQVCFVNSNHGTIHLVADHLGTITADNYTPATTTGAPHRKVDTRIELGT